MPFSRETQIHRSSLATLQGTYIEDQPYVLVPLKTLIELLGRNAPVKVLTTGQAAQTEEVGLYEYQHRHEW